MGTIDLDRREVHYTGRVQGVGFRHTVNRLASNFDVTGCVRNLPNGQVLLIAEGASEDVDALLRAVASEMQDNITDQQIVRDVYQGAFDSFEIAY